LLKTSDSFIFGSKVELKCFTSVVPHSVIWKFKDTLVAINRVEMTWYRDGYSGSSDKQTHSLIINKMLGSYNGVYECLVEKNEVAITGNISVKLLPENLGIPVSTEHTLTCDESLNLTSSDVIWMKDEVVITNEMHSIIQVGQCLNISDMSTYHVGIYSCYVEKTKYRTIDVTSTELIIAPTAEEKAREEEEKRAKEEIERLALEEAARKAQEEIDRIKAEEEDVLKAEKEEIERIKVERAEISARIKVEKEEIEKLKAEEQELEKMKIEKDETGKPLVEAEEIVGSLKEAIPKIDQDSVVADKEKIEPEEPVVEQATKKVPDAAAYQIAVLLVLVTLVPLIISKVRSRRTNNVTEGEKNGEYDENDNYVEPTKKLVFEEAVTPVLKPNFNPTADVLSRVQKKINLMETKILNESFEETKTKSTTELVKQNELVQQSSNIAEVETNTLIQATA